MDRVQSKIIDHLMGICHKKGFPVSKKMLLNVFDVTNEHLFKYLNIAFPDGYGLLCEEDFQKAYIECWYKKGLLHRDDDMPAEIFYYSGTKVWYKNGKVHRDDPKKPALVKENGVKEYYVDNYFIGAEGSDSPSKPILPSVSGSRIGNWVTI